MKYAFIDNQKKPLFLKVKPEVYTFETGNNLYIFPGRCRTKRLNRALSKYSYSLFPKDCSYDLKIKIWYKTIVKTMKEYGFTELIICSEKYMNHIKLLNCIYKNNIEFSITSTGDFEDVVDYFLEKFGLPVRATTCLESGLVVYIDGAIKHFKNNILDLSGTLTCEKIIVSEYILKNTPFPIIINSLHLLEGALILTGIEIEDIIIKLCIIGTKRE